MGAFKPGAPLALEYTGDMEETTQAFSEAPQTLAPGLVSPGRLLHSLPHTDGPRQLLSGNTSTPTTVTINHKQKCQVTGFFLMSHF